MAVKSVKAATLIEDLTIYPRHQVDEQYINRLADSIRAGDVLPPIIVQRGTGRIVDGFHRRRAILKVQGQEAMIDVVERVYASEAAMFAEAMRLNARHGEGLTKYDMARCALRGGELGLDEEQIATALSVTKTRLADIMARKIAYAEDSHAVPIKMTAGHLAGETMTADQERGMRRTTGLNPLTYVNQVINLLEHDLINWENERLVSRLRELHSTLGTALAKQTGVAMASD